MSIKQFDTNDNKTFWQSNKAPFQADLNAEPLVKMVKGYIGEAILDAGAANGSLINILKKYYPNSKIVGVDLVPKCDEVLEADLTNLPFDENEYDTVFCTEVIEHVSNAVAVKMLKEINRVMNSGGILILTTPFDENLDENIVTCPCCNTEFHRWGHQQSFREQDFKSLVDESGFRELHIIPLKMRRVARYGSWARSYFLSKLYKSLPCKGKGNLKLLLIAQKNKD